MDLLALVGFITIIYLLVYIIYPWFLDCDIRLALHEKFGKPISSLRGKVVWITGASSGIGEHLAYVLATAGCKLILSARRQAELERVKSNCLSKNANLKDSDVEVYAFDMCNLEIHEHAFQHVISKFGRLDILVNNAGRSQRAIWENIDMAVDKEMFHLNVFSHVNLSRVVAKYFLQVGQGHLVVNSSIAGISCVPFSATYCATKHALHGYFSTFIIEKLGKQIPVTIICPGPIQTNFLSECFTEKLGERYGLTAETSKSKVGTERCAILMGVAIANELEEVWIAKPLPLQVIYFTQYYPNIGYWVIKQLGPRFLQYLRDAKTSIKQDG